MSASPDKVQELIERFERNLPAYKQGRYNETLGARRVHQSTLQSAGLGR